MIVGSFIVTQSIADHDDEGGNDASLKRNDRPTQIFDRPNTARKECLSKMMRTSILKGCT